MATILVAEDDDSTRGLMCAVLKRAGFDVLAAADGCAAIDMFDTHNIDLLVTDVMMPGFNGLELTRMLREVRFDLPILMVTAKGQPAERREGFLVGTDDYLVKPVDAQEMVLRVQALLRRARIVADNRITVGSTVLDYRTLVVEREEERQVLPPKEFYLLYKLLAYPDQVFTRVQLHEEIWGPDSDSDAATVSVHINRLRSRFAECPDFEIATVRGLGYKAVRKNG